MVIQSTLYHAGLIAITILNVNSKIRTLPAAKLEVCVSNKTEHHCPIYVFNCTRPGYVFKLPKFFM